VNNPFLLVLVLVNDDADDTDDDNVLVPVVTKPWHMPIPIPAQPLLPPSESASGSTTNKRITLVVACLLLL
jgi:hypothetical protein